MVYDLLCGIGPQHIRILCDNPLDGGHGICPIKVGDMTLDQIYMMLTDRSLLRGSERSRSREMEGVVATSLADKDGFVRGRAEDGTPIKGVIRGKSLARQLMEEEDKTTKKNQRSQNREKRRQRRAERRKNGT